VARLLGDENFPLPVVIELRSLGYDVVTLQEAGHANQAMPDDAVLALASRDGRAVLTLNRRHFIRLHATTPDHGGIIVCTFDPDFTALAARIHAAIEERGQLSGQFVRVNRPAR
jgi:predicted nuclease of predicted toxin-antitoxin system